MSYQDVRNIVEQAWIRGEEEYEQVRQDIVWNERVPDRFPEVIVRVRDEQEVAAVVRWAGERQLRVTARSGGHSFAGTSLADGSVLIDLSALRTVEVDTEQRVARVGPGIHGMDLLAELAPHDLFFPVGHCSTVGIGGFLLGGGYGWLGRKYGEACLSVRAVDVVTADGELIRADAEHNTDYFWAARGAGPGFFGIVTRFHLDLYPRPAVAMLAGAYYPLESREEVLRWVWETSGAAHETVELLVVLGGVPDLTDRTNTVEGVLVVAWTLNDDEEEARSALEFVAGCPAGHFAAVEPTLTTMADLYELVDQVDPPDHRYAVDNMWTTLDSDAVIPRLVSILDDRPSHQSYLGCFLWRVEDPADAAVSSPGDMWLTIYAISPDPAVDEAGIAWVTDNMKQLEPFSNGVMINDENLARRFDRPLAAEKLRRLRELHAKYDPSGRFLSLPGIDGVAG